MAEKPTSSWNSLEFAKLIVSVMTPVVVALVGFLISKQLAMQDLQWKGNQALVERRIKSYDTIKDELNRVHCFINDVGTWKEENPETIIACKRHMDQVMYTERAFWSPETFDAYLDYTNNAAFCPFRGVGQNAQIRTVTTRKKLQIQVGQRTHGAISCVLRTPNTPIATTECMPRSRQIWLLHSQNKPEQDCELCRSQLGCSTSYRRMTEKAQPYSFAR